LRVNARARTFKHENRRRHRRFQRPRQIRQQGRARVSPDVVPKIFQPFFTTKTANKGTGLGLAIVHRFVKEGKGAIHLQTKLGKGTTFTVYLPAHDFSAKK